MYQVESLTVCSLSTIHKYQQFWMKRRRKHCIICQRLVSAQLLHLREFFTIQILTQQPKEKLISTSTTSQSLIINK